MEEKLVKIINEMADYLNIAQMKKLQEVLIKNLSDARPEKGTDFKSRIFENVY